MAQSDHQSDVFPPSGLSTTTALSDSSSSSSASSYQGRLSNTTNSSPNPSIAFEESTPHRPKNPKRNSNMMKRSYSKVVKSTSSIFKPKSRRQSFGQINLNSPSNKEQTISLAELDARLHILEQAEHSTTDSENSPYPLPTPVSRNKPSLTPHFTTPIWKGTPCLNQVSENDDQVVPSSNVHTPTPTHPVNEPRSDRLLIYLVAALLAIPNVALSWAPMTVTIIVGSAIAVLCGYRLAVALPVLMLLNPASPIWRENGSRMRGRDVIVFSPHQSGNRVHRSRQPSPNEKRLIAPTRRHSTI